MNLLLIVLAKAVATFQQNTPFGVYANKLDRNITLGDRLQLVGNKTIEVLTI